MKAPNIEEITAEHLQAPVAKMLRKNKVDIIAWTTERMKGGTGNPVTIGLYYIYGKVLSGFVGREFSLVLKIIQSPDNIGIDLGGGDDQRHWNYWQREPLFYQSKLAKQLPKGLAAPKCYGVDHWDGRIKWLWIEEIDHCREVEHQVDELAFPARHLGRLNAKYTSPNKLPTVPWLGTNTLAQWLQPIPGYENPILNGKELNWSHPHIQALFPSSSLSPFRRFWENLDAHLALLDTLPSTWCHGDSDPSNFRILETASTTQSCRPRLGFNVHRRPRARYRPPHFWQLLLLRRRRMGQPDRNCLQQLPGRPARFWVARR